MEKCLSFIFKLIKVLLDFDVKNISEEIWIEKGGREMDPDHLSSPFKNSLRKLKCMGDKI